MLPRDAWLRPQVAKHHKQSHQMLITFDTSRVLFVMLCNLPQITRCGNRVYT